MEAIAVTAHRVFHSTGKTFAELEAALLKTLRRFDPETAASMVQRHAPWPEVEKTIAGLAGELGMMIIARAGQGAMTSLSGRVKHCSMYFIGNPVIANDILDIDIRASLYVPMRVCLFAPDDGPSALVTYELPSTLFANLGKPELEPFGKLLDGKLEAVVAAISK